MFKTPTLIWTAWEWYWGQPTVVLDSPTQRIKQPLVLPSQALFPIKPILMTVFPTLTHSGIGRPRRRWPHGKRGHFITKIIIARTERGISCFLYFGFITELPLQGEQRHKTALHCWYLLCWDHYWILLLSGGAFVAFLVHKAVSG